MTEFSDTTKRMFLFFAVILAFIYSVTSTGYSLLADQRLEFQAIVSNFIVRWILLLPVTILGGLISTQLRAAFTGFTFFQQTVAFILVFLVYTGLLYYYFYAVATIIVSKFRR